MIQSREEIARRRTWAFRIGCAGAAVAAVLGMFGPHDASIWRVPRVLKANVETALANAGMPGVAVVMSGQRATLHGVLPTAETLDVAKKAALSAAGPGGLWAGGVTSIDETDLRTGPAAAPFSWRVSREGREVILSGAVPSEYARRALMRAAVAAFPNAETPIDHMELAGGAPAPNWLEVARDAIAQLGKLKAGQARMVDDRVVLIADAPAEAAAAARAHYEHLPAPFSARVDIAVAGEEGALAGLSGGGAEACEQAFTGVMANNVINFETGSAGIDASSRALLDTLASVALRCDRFTIEVAGHTDDSGARTVNMDLSQRRAQAVVDYLASQGVSSARMRAIGYGPDRPVASNATPQGQAANRRIEFNVGA